MEMSPDEWRERVSFALGHHRGHVNMMEALTLTLTPTLALTLTLTVTLTLTLTLIGEHRG